MSYDEYGQEFYTEDELIKLIHINPEMDLANVLLDKPTAFNTANRNLFAGFPTIKQYSKPIVNVAQFDEYKQSQWHMPDDYKKFDILNWLVEQCTADEQVDRVAQELALYDERNLLPLLRFLKYMIDTFRKNDIVWGVGRGSSVSSYVLYLLGVHKIDSMAYNSDVTDFLR